MATVEGGVPSSSYPHLDSTTGSPFSLQASLAQGQINVFFSEFTGKIKIDGGRDLDLVS